MNPTAVDLPVLEPGDHLTGEDFDHRYELRPDIHKAELVHGVVYMPSPVRALEHGDPVNLMNTWLGNYALTHPGTRASSDASVRLSGQDRVQPDVSLRRSSSGSSTLGDDHYLLGAPELVVEVAASSAAYDLHEKKDAYLRAGVQEYLVWRTVDGAIDWFVLRDGEYAELAADSDGITRSRVFPGLQLDTARLLSGDYTAVLPQG